MPFMVGTSFTCGSDFEAAGGSHADLNNFVIRINNSKYFQEEEVSKAKQYGKPLPSDLLKYVQLTCSKGGKMKKKKQPSVDLLQGDDEFVSKKTKQSRNRKSENCGCTWAVSGSWHFDNACFKIVSVNLQHSGGCDPTPGQQRVMLRKKTRGKVERLAPAVLNSVREMMEDNFPLAIIRKRIRNKIPVTLLTDAVYFRNLKLKFERQKKKGLVPTLPESQIVEHQVQHEDTSVLESVSVASATRALIAPTLAYEGVKIIYILQKLKADVPGFEYRLFIDDATKQLAGWVYMTPRQRAALKKCGQVWFVDSKAKGTNLHNFPFFAPALINQDGKHEVFSYGCVCAAGNAAVEWVLRSIVDMCPESVHVCKTMFTDDAISTETVQAAVPKATHLLCAFHIIDLNITKMANKCKYAHAERLRTILWSKVAHARCVTDLQQTVRALEDLRVPKPVAASLRYWFGKIEQWGGPYIRNHFTLNFNGNTMGEVSFSAVMKWVTTPDHFEQLFFDLQERERTVALVRQKQADDELMSIVGLPSDRPEIKQARNFFSSHAVRLFEAQLYAVECYNLLEIAVQSPAENRRFQIFIPNQKSVPRQVAVAGQGAILFCDCLMYSTCGITCAHCLVVFKFLNCGLFDRSFFHPRWARVTQVEFDTSITAYKPTISHPTIAGECPEQNLPGSPDLDFPDFLDEGADTHDTMIANNIDAQQQHQDPDIQAEVIPSQLVLPLIDNSPSKHPPKHNRYTPRKTSSMQPSYASLMKTCEEVCRYCINVAPHSFTLSRHCHMKHIHILFVF